MATVVGNGTESAYTVPYTRLRRARSRRAIREPHHANSHPPPAVEIRSRASASRADRLAGRPGFACEPGQVDTQLSHPPGFLLTLETHRSLASRAECPDSGVRPEDASVYAYRRDA